MAERSPYFDVDLGEDKDKKKTARAEHHAARLGEPLTADRSHRLGSRILRPFVPETTHPERPAELYPRQRPVPDEVLLVRPALSAEAMQHMPEQVVDTDDEDDTDTVRETPAATIPYSMVPRVLRRERQPEQQLVPNVAAVLHKMAQASGRTDMPEALSTSRVFAAEAGVPDEPSHNANNEVVRERVTDAADQHEQTPTQDLHHAGDILPPVPPSTGDTRGGGHAEPWERPAGGLSDTTVLASVSALEARRRLDELHHTSRENGLTAAVGILGLGLVVEHFIAKRRDKKLKRELDTQSRVVQKTRETLQQEQQAHRGTAAKLERMVLNQQMAQEQPNKMPAATVPERVIATNLERPGVPPVTAEKVLKDQLAHNREVGQAIKRNPELQELTNVGNIRQTVEAGASTPPTPEIAPIQQPKEDLERLRSRYSNASGLSQINGGFNASAPPTFPQLQPPTIGTLPDPTSSQQAYTDQPSHASASLAKPVAVATVLIILAVIFILAFTR